MGATPVLFAARGPVAEQNFEPFQRIEPERQRLVALILQFRHRQQPARASGMAGNKNQVAVRRALGREAEKMFHLRGLAVFVSAEETDVQVEARKLEIVHVAAEERDLLFGREHEPHVGVTLELIQMIRATLPERDDIRPHSGAIL